jgi:ABC-type multidrug transport system fused ATPase/permease subunit
MSISKDIPTIGGARGIFEIFVPGVFLLLNLTGIVYLLPFTDTNTKNLILVCFSNPILSLIIIICFGYLIGVILRLFRTEKADRLSAKWNQKFNSYARQEDGTLKLWAYEEFPYIGWIGEVCKLYLPPNALDFYNKTWTCRRLEGQNRQFFNFCKTMINSVDERATNEIYSAEALSRYISGIFYSLVISSALLFLTTILHFIISGKIMILLLLILFAYFLAIVVLLRYFRFIRIKEVEIVFAATFENRSIFEKETKTPVNMV